MNNYKGFYVDLSKYLHALNLEQCDYGDSGLYNFGYFLPESIVDNITEYFIKFDQIESEFVEHPNCGSQISKIHPIYTKASICPPCVFEF